MNVVPLFVTIISRMPWVVNNDRSYWIVELDVTELTILTSSHLQWQSVITKNIFAINDPAWSICNCIHGLNGHSQGIMDIVYGVGMSLFCFYFHLFFFLAILLFLAYYAQYFARSWIICSKFSYIASNLTVISHTYIPKLYTNIIDSCSYRLIINAKC